MYKWCISLVQKSESKDEKQAWFWMNECSRFVFSFWKECFTVELLLSCLKCGIIYMDGGGGEKTEEDGFVLTNFYEYYVYFRAIDTSEASSWSVE